MMGGTESGIICPFKALLPLLGAEILVLLAMMDSSAYIWHLPDVQGSWGKGVGCFTLESPGDAKPRSGGRAVACPAARIPG